MQPLHQPLFVDDKGRTRSIEDEQIRCRLGITASPAELEDFAVKVLGFIGLRARAGRIRIMLRPLLVTGEAVAGACLLLAERAPTRVALSALHESGEWTDAIFGTPVAAMRAIEELVGSPPMPNSPYRSIERPVQTLLRRPMSDPLAAVLNVWSSQLGRYNADAERTLDDLTNPARSSVLESTRGDNRLLIRRWGAGTFYSPEWNRQAVGREIEDQPDQDYGCRVAANMRRCAMAGDPMLHEVEAVIDDPLGFATRITYRRLVLRWEESANVELVTTTSLVSAARRLAG